MFRKLVGTGCYDNDVMIRSCVIFLFVFFVFKDYSCEGVTMWCWISLLVLKGSFFCSTYNRLMQSFFLLM